MFFPVTFKKLSQSRPHCIALVLRIIMDCNRFHLSRTNHRLRNGLMRPRKAILIISSSVRNCPWAASVPPVWGSLSGSTNNLSERASAGFLLMSLFSSSFRIIWCIVGGETLKNLCKSAYAGGLPFITV